MATKKKVVKVVKTTKARPKSKKAAFAPPDWGNVMPPDVDPALTAMAESDEPADPHALIAHLQAGSSALAIGGVFWDDDLVDTLTPAEKRAHKKVYQAAASARRERDGLHRWVVDRLAQSPEGQAHLLWIAATGEHPTSLREHAARALDGEWAKVAAELDPTAWLGDANKQTCHVYAVGVTAALVIDPARAFTAFAPLLDKKAALKTEKSRSAAIAVLWGIKAYIGQVIDDDKEEHEWEPERDPKPLAPFTPLVVKLLGDEEISNFALFTLARLPHEESVAAAAAAYLGPSPTEVPYWNEHAIELICRSNDPRYIPWLGAALAKSWMHWGRVFRGLETIGAPEGIAIIEAWMVDNSASDRTGPAAAAIATMAKRGQPTDEQRAAAARLFESKKKPKKKK
ncbi:MAG: hypothetical protein ABI867_27370 [Kofleriaceae bacterium]